MHPAKCSLVLAALAMSFVPLCRVAAAQVPFNQLPPVMDASMPRAEQISIALSAGPKAVASRATVYVLGHDGYEIARQGGNGASCLVGRHFVNPRETTVEPMCFDAEGTRTLLQAELYAARLRAQGKTEAEIKQKIAAGYKDGRLTVPAKPGVEYMLSSDNRLGPTRDHGTARVPPHLMFYAPFLTAKDLGFGSASPVAPFLAEPGQPDARMVVFPH